MKYMAGSLIGLFLLLLMDSTFAQAVQGSLRPEYPRTEYRVDPLGIDIRLPRLSWLVTSEERAQRQTAYQVLVASSRELLEADRIDRWDSGKVVSAETTAIIYAGRGLAARDECFWKVRVWDARDRSSSWSQIAHWSMGLLEKSDWKAQWIGYDRPADKIGAEDAPLRLPPARYLRCEFQVGKPIRRATLHSSALGIYQMHFNGKRVGSEYFAPGWTDYDRRVYYQTHDVTGLVKQGGNALGAILADGWYAGYLGFGGERDQYGNHIRLLAQLEIEYTDGTRSVVASGPDWQAATGPLVAADFLMGERYDARLELPGWDQPGLDVAAWHEVDVTSDLKARVQASPGVAVREMRPIRPVEITEPAPGQQVVNLGQNFAGVVRLKLRGERGRRIQL